MLSRIWFIVHVIVITAVAFILLLMGLSQANAIEKDAPVAGTTPQKAAAEGEPGIQATDRISIPYGFDFVLPLVDDGDTVVTSGEGACTADENITIVFTVTQALSGASAAGVWNGVCTGNVQTWKGVGTHATPSPNFIGGAAEACATAETSDGGSVTDTQEWCDDVVIAPHALLLPIIQSP